MARVTAERDLDIKALLDTDTWAPNRSNKSVVAEKTVCANTNENNAIESDAEIENFTASFENMKILVGKNLFIFLKIFHRHY